MILLKKIWAVVLFTCFVIFIAACHATHNKNEIRVGTISGPETQLMYVAKKVLAQQSNLHLKIIEFSDYSLPNRALSDGSLDANMFQHQFFLDKYNQYHHDQLVSIAKIFIYPMGIYSKKVTSLAKIPVGAQIAIPNDPSNESRALLLLQQAGLITLKVNTGHPLAILLDILSNPKQLKIKELDAAQLSRSLYDVTAAVINSNYAVLSHIDPQHEALFLENSHSPYANLLVVKNRDKNNLHFIALAKALQSDQVLAKAEQLFHHQAIPAWQLH